MLDAEELARAAETGLDLIRDEQDAVTVAELPQLAQEIERRRHEPALAQDRLDHDRGDAVGRDLRFEEVAEVGERRLRRPAAIRIGKGGLVDLRRVGAEILLVRLDAAGEAEGQ